MKKLRSISTLLLVIVVGACIARTQQAPSNQVKLAYSAKLSPHSKAILLRSPHGITYQLSLVPDSDGYGNVIVLDLFLQKPGVKPDHSNFLDWTGKLHGYQPYVFAASDFAGGAQKSMYGESRKIDLPKLGMQMRVKVLDVHVEPTPEASAQVPNYQFDDLSLEITTQGFAEGSSVNSGR